MLTMKRPLHTSRTLKNTFSMPVEINFPNKIRFLKFIKRPDPENFNLFLALEVKRV